MVEESCNLLKRISDEHKQLKKWTIIIQWTAEVARIKEDGQGIFLEAKSLEPKTNFIMLHKLGA